jgi:hypothetical protein
MTVVRDYGATAGEKSKELIEHLLLATLSVSIHHRARHGVPRVAGGGHRHPGDLGPHLAIYYFMGYTSTG